MNVWKVEILNSSQRRLEWGTGTACFKEEAGFSVGMTTAKGFGGIDGLAAASRRMKS